MANLLIILVALVCAVVIGLIAFSPLILARFINRRIGAKNLRRVQALLPPELAAAPIFSVKYLPETKSDFFAWFRLTGPSSGFLIVSKDLVAFATLSKSKLILEEFTPAISRVSWSAPQPNTGLSKFFSLSKNSVTYYFASSDSSSKASQELYDQVSRIIPVDPKGELLAQLTHQKLVSSGASQLKLVALLSGLNTILSLTGTNLVFLIGLGFTQVFDAMALVFPSDLKFFFIAINLGVCGVFYWLSLEAPTHTWAIITGALIYGLDMLILLGIYVVSQDHSLLLNLIFHVYILFALISSLRARQNPPSPQL